MMAGDLPITKLHVSTDSDEEHFLSGQGFSRINVDLNSGNSGRKVLLWYKKEHGERPVTRIQFSFNDKFHPGLSSAGFEQIPRDLNAGAGGDFIHLWYLCGGTDDDVPIVDLKVTVKANDEPGLLRGGYERLGCDLNRHAKGDFVYLWAKRTEPTYICEITSSFDFDYDSTYFSRGFTRVDEDTNRGAKGDYVFLWYRRSKDRSRALSAVEVSTATHEEFSLKDKGFTQVTKDLNKGAGGPYVHVWSRSDGNPKVQGINLLIDPKARSEYMRAGLQVIDKNLNEGTKGWEMRLAYYAA